MKANKLFILIITIFLFIGIIPSFASSETVFDVSFDDATSKYDYYYDWYAADWDGISFEKGALKNSNIFLSKKNYINYDFQVAVKAPKGNMSTFSKSYIAIRQPSGYGFTSMELGLEELDGQSSDNGSRPGYVGILFATVGSEIEVIIHTEDASTESGYYNASYILSVPDLYSFLLDFVPLEIKDTGSDIILSCNGKMICEIQLEAVSEKTVKTWEGDCYTGYTVLDSSGNTVMSGSNALVPVCGAVSSVNHNCYSFIESLSLTSLSGSAEDAIVEGRYFDYDSIYLKKYSDNPEQGAVVARKAKYVPSTDTIVITVVVFVIALALIALVIYVGKSLKLKVIISSVLGLAVVIFTLIMIFGLGMPTKTITTNIDYLIDRDTIYTLDEDGNTPQVRLYSSDLTATDALGRTLPTYEEVGDTKEGKYVGMFYTLWTCRANTLNDNTKLLAQNPSDPQYGSVYSFHWFTEPEVGYYTSTDEWVIRRDMVYLNLAGVDYIYLDFTNGGVYEEAFDVLLETCLQMREEGTQTPCIVPWIFADDSCTYSDLSYVFRKYYSQEKYRQLWFYMDGKPLAMIKRVEGSHIVSGDESGYLPVLLNDEINDFFTFRFAWVPSENDDGHYPGEKLFRWSWGNPLWMHNYTGYPYVYGWDEEEGVAEQCTIIVGNNCFDPYGRSGSAGTLDQFKEKDTTPYGLYFEEQATWVLENMPEVEYVNINGWNEWMAQYNPDYGHNYFVDSYNREYSRDMSPISGSYNDDYYYQLCSFIRRFKGMEKPEDADDEESIDITGSFDQWDNVDTEYSDYVGDATHRNSTDTTGTISYVNNTGRNDISVLKVSYDASYVYFYAETAEALTPSTDSNWMLLLIDSDCDTETGFQGCDYLINYSVIDDTKTVICKYIDNIWQEIGIISYKYEENKLMISVPRSLIGQTSGKISFNFHWLDNVTDVYILEDWFLTGDSAPERRHMYMFEADADYDSSGEKYETRTEGAIKYMPARDVTPESEGLILSKYTIAKNYGKQPELNLLNVGSTATVDTISAVKFGTSYALKFDGYILASSDGNYTFTVTSDDGCTVYIDGRLIIDNSGVHTASTKSGSILLSEGYHTISVEYFENGNGDSCLEFSCDKEIKFYN